MRGLWHEAGVLPIPFINEAGVRILLMRMMLFSAEDGKIIGMKQVPVNTWKDEAAPALAELIRETGKLPVGIIAGETDFLPLLLSPYPKEENRKSRRLTHFVYLAAPPAVHFAYEAPYQYHHSHFQRSPEH